MMEAVAGSWAEHTSETPITKLRSRVILALDQFTPEERAAVEQTVRAFVRGEAPATRLSDDGPFYLLRATPDLLLIVQYKAGGPVIVEDVVTQATRDYLAHAG